ncbi:hypothetical protein JL722_5594 [Aureococcus anophagefferens]|nr:hypothetical protein JL722_5594 [Aureococcus anophagefferens]
MAASTDDDEARRLAELIGGDSDSDEEETDADRLRMAQLLGRRGISDEASDDDDEPVVTTPALVPRAPPAPPQLVVLPPEVRSGTKRNPEVGGIGATTAEGLASPRAHAQRARRAPSGVHGPEPPPPPRRAPPPEPLEPVRAPPVLQHLLDRALDRDGDATSSDEDVDVALGPDAAPAGFAETPATVPDEPNDEAVDEDELDLRRDAPVVVESDEDAAVFCRAAALAHDVATAGGCEIEVDFVWENEARDDPRSAGQALASMAGRFAKKGAPPSPPPPDKPWRPAEPAIRNLPPRAAAAAAALRVPRAAGARPVDSRVHGSDRRSAADAPPDAWLYARAWPPDDVGYDHVEESAKKVRCRRWVRPRERVAVAPVVSALLDAGAPAAFAAEFRRRARGDVLDVDAALAALLPKPAPAPAAAAPPPPPPPPPPARSPPRTAPDLGDGVTIDYVWENQRWRPTGVQGQGTWDNGALLRRAPYDGGSRVELGRLFRKHGGPPSMEAELVPEDSGLPLDGDEGRRSTAWRWLGPWVIDSRSFGAERVLGADEPEPGADGWLYGFDWPRDGAGYAARPTPRSFVRCRRWVRPREPLDAGKPPSRSHSEEDGLIPIDDPGAPPPPRASNVKLFS